MRVQAAGAAGGRSIAGRGGSGTGRRGRGERAPAASPPRGRVRAVVACPAVRRAGVSPKAPGGGGEPRAARPRADVATSRSRSAPSPPPRDPRAAGRRRARSLAARLALSPPSAHPAPRLRPVFLWARQSDGTVQEVRCEDYDPRNRIRIARTPSGWRVIPRTEIFDSILVPAAPVREKPERRRRRRPGRPRRRRVEATAPALPWLAPDLESHIPSHTIAVPRAPPQPPPPPPPPEPTPLDNLLAVAELEFNQQRGEEALELELQGDTTSQYPFLPEAEEVARDVMSFQLGEPKQADEMFFDRKSHPPERPSDEDFQSDIAHVHKDLFETISEAHYLPELGGPHDEALLESLVEKGCEDNQILGQTLDKFAHLVHGGGDYVEEEDDLLLGGAPVTDIIDRLGQTLESPSRSSMTAAQGLLHLHHIGDHLAPPDHQPGVEQTYITEEVFTNAEAQSECPLETLTAVSEMQQASEVNQLDYDQNAEKRLQTDDDPTDAMYTDQVPDLPYGNKNTLKEEQNQPLPGESDVTLPDQSELTLPCDISNTESCIENVVPKVEAEDSNEGDTNMMEEKPNLDILKQQTQSDESSDGGTDAVELVATDLSKKACDKKSKHKITHTTEESITGKSEVLPKDLSVHRKLPTPHASPKRIDIPRAPSRESDAMQSPQPSGIPAVPSSPEIFTMPQTKSKQSLFLESLLSSPSPKMYTSEVTITKQNCEPLNLGKHRKSASPTVTSCSDEMRKFNKEFGEPQEKRRRESTEDLVKISKVFNRCERDDQADSKSDLPPKTSEKRPKEKDEINAVKQLQFLKTSPTFNIPDPLLIPKDKLNAILASPGREIPALLMQRPELRLPEAFAYPAILQDPDILVVSLSQLESILENGIKPESPKTKEKSSSAKSASSSDHTSIAVPDQTSQPKNIPSMDALAGDIDAATSAAFNQMMWLPYLSQIEAMATCSQNADFLKALHSSGYPPPNYQDLQLMNSGPRVSILNTAFPMGPNGLDYENRIKYAIWQDTLNNPNISPQMRAKHTLLMETQMKEMAAKCADVQNPYVHSTKNQQREGHKMSSRSSPMAANFNAAAAAVVAGQHAAAMQHNSFLQNMYPGINPNIRPNVPLSGLQISPYYNHNMMGRDQRSPRSSQQKSPSSPFYPNNNYLQSVQSKQPDMMGHPQRSNSTGSHQSTESPRPRISVKSLHNLLEPTAAAAANGPHGSSGRRHSNPQATAMGRRREEPEVGSTTPLGEGPLMPPHPHDPASFHLWHPLFGNQKSYNSPWSWTTVTATGD